MADWTRYQMRNGRGGRGREREKKLSDEAGVGNVKLSLPDLWRKMAA